MCIMVLNQQLSNGLMNNLDTSTDAQAARVNRLRKNIKVAKTLEKVLVVLIGCAASFYLFL